MLKAISEVGRLDPESLVEARYEGIRKLGRFIEEEIKYFLNKANFFLELRHMRSDAVVLPNARGNRRPVRSSVCAITPKVRVK